MLSDYDYHLPEAAIAQSPAEPRDASRLLVLDPLSGISHARFRNLGKFLSAGDLLVLNDARVSARRLHGRRPTGGRAEALLLRRLEPNVYEALAKPARRLRQGALILFDCGLEAKVVGEEAGGSRLLMFCGGEDAAPAIEAEGEVPLPPYIRSPIRDPERYQTVYSERPGSSAAPTAGLHFTRALIKRLERMGVATAAVTLDVGFDTFRPIQEEEAEDHEMHGESFSIPPETAEKVASAKGRVIAVGTTAVRALESAAQGRRQVATGSAVSSLFIKPGFEFRVVDAMITNFHMPRTTMLLMVSAFCGRENLFAAYGTALRHGYRFLSFGDSMFITRRAQT